MKQPFFYRSIPLGEMHELIKLEPKLADFINFDHPFNVRLMPDHFQCLVHSVISQQLSSAAVDTI
jgi:3-methyladenine DNA glycosylase/8-oxoguanine DNA glycosylase